MKNMFSKIARSPLLHFLLIGAGIYMAYGVFNNDASGTDSPDTLRVSAGEIASLEDSWAKLWQRPPTPTELQGLIDDFIRETVLYREAIAMGLARDDVIIRRRMAQKLEFLFQDLADTIEPTDEELRAHFTKNSEGYRELELITVTQIFVDPDRRGDQTLTDAEEMLVKLTAMESGVESVGEMGDPFMLQSYYPERSKLEISKLFGHEFAQSIFELETGRWHGPLLSGYGVHLIYIHSRSESPDPVFELVSDLVRQDWQTSKRAEVNEQFVSNLKSRYEIVIEGKDANEGSTKP